MKQSDSANPLAPIAFAITWSGAFSILWLFVRTNGSIQAMVGWEVILGSPQRLSYLAAIYAAAYTAVVWAGLGLYLLLEGAFTLRKFSVGLPAGLLTVLNIGVAGMLVPGNNALWVNYLTVWVPMLLVLLLSIWAVHPGRDTL